MVSLQAVTRPAPATATASQIALMVRLRGKVCGLHAAEIGRRLPSWPPEVALRRRPATPTLQLVCLGLSDFLPARRRFPSGGVQRLTSNVPLRLLLGRLHAQNHVVEVRLARRARGTT